MLTSQRRSGCMAAAKYLPKPGKLVSPAVSRWMPGSMRTLFGPAMQPQDGCSSEPSNTYSQHQHALESCTQATTYAAEPQVLCVRRYVLAKRLLEQRRRRSSRKPRRQS